MIILLYQCLSKPLFNPASNSNKKLTVALNKFGPQSVEMYYKKLLNLNKDKFAFQNLKSSSILKVLKNINKTKLPVLTKFRVEFKM